MSKTIGHVGIIVRDIENVAKKMADFFELDLPEIRDVPERKMKVALIKLDNIDIELIEDYSDDGLFSRCVQERGNILHHFALISQNLETDIIKMKERGVQFAAPEPVKGLRGKKIIFVSPSTLCGINVELTEP